LKKNLETKTLKEATKMTHPKNYASHAAYKISVSLNLFYFIIINYSKHSEKGHLDIATDHFDFALKKVEKDVARKEMIALQYLKRRKRVSKRQIAVRYKQSPAETLKESWKYTHRLCWANPKINFNIIIQLRNFTKTRPSFQL